LKGKEFGLFKSYLIALQINNKIAGECVEKCDSINNSDQIGVNLEKNEISQGQSRVLLQKKKKGGMVVG
jgi:hypothetical protein